jgi:Putative peptidoglycan binding domain
MPPQAQGRTERRPHPTAAAPVVLARAPQLADGPSVVGAVSMLVDRVASGRRMLGWRRLQAYVSVVALAVSGLAFSGSAMAAGNPFAGRGMWIWVLSRSSGGSVPAIVAQAKRYGVTTVMIKAGDGSSAWSQFNAPLVRALHASGLKVCAWQYVYGTYPTTEAQVGATAVRDGADCLLIDAESQYEGKYVQAQAYIQRLRSLIGASMPVALAGFPYMDYHPGFPYSVFLGPGGAQYNVPQMYWKDIGTTVDAVYAHTFAYNRLYGRPVSPLGQVYNNPPASQIERFRQLSRAYGSPNVSWWDWQEAPSGAWRAISQPVGAPTGFRPYTLYATLGKGAAGDVVVWAQEHLVSAGEPLTIDGGFGPKTQAAVAAFQTAHGLTPSGQIDQATWQSLLGYQPVQVKWVVRGRHQTATASSANGGTRVPQSASLRAKGYEIPRSLGAGRP